MMKRVLAAAVFTVFAVACGPLEITIDDKQGIPPLKGEFEFPLNAFTCGQDIAAGNFTVKTRAYPSDAGATGCEFSFGEQVPLLKPEDYAKISAFASGAGGANTNLVKRIELRINEFKLENTAGATPVIMPIDTSVTSADIKLNGQALANKTNLVQLPSKVTVSGDLLNGLKASIDKREAVTVGVVVSLVIPNSPPPPAKMKVTYNTQPAIVVGPPDLLPK